MFKLSHRFFWYYKKQCLLVCFAVVISVMVLTNALLLMRSSLATEYEMGLNEAGNYNFVFSHMSLTMCENLQASHYFSSIGVLWDEGSIVVGDETYQLVSSDDEGIQLYHQNCREGHYPQNETEIAASSNVLRALGVPVKLGSRITANVMIDGKMEEKEWVVCGILDSINRWWDSEEDTDFIYPEIFVGQSLAKSICCVVALEKQDVDIDKLYEYLNQKGYIYYDSWGRTGTDQSFITNAVETSQSEVQEMMQSVPRAFESAILIPAFSLVISVFAILFIYFSLKNVIRERMKSFHMYSLLGFSQKQIFSMLLIELAILLSVSALVGLAGGIVFYKIIYWIQTLVDGTKPLSGMAVNEIVEAVSINPYRYSLVLTGQSALIAVVFVLVSTKAPSPLDAVQTISSNSLTKKRRISKNINQYISHAIQFSIFQRSAVMVVVICTYAILFFGSLYLYGNYKSSVEAYNAELEILGLKDMEYLSSKNFSKGNYEVACLNRRNRGITEDEYAALMESPEVEEIQGCIEIKSIKLLEKKEEKKQLLNQESLMRYSEETMSGFEELIEKTQKKHGYSMEEYGNLFNIPISAVSPQCISEKFSQDYIIDGAIDLEQINEGKEIILFLPDKDAETIYQVGEKVHFTDLTIESKDMEDYNFSTGNILPGMIPDFTYQYESDMTGEILTQEAYAIGERIDFEATIGAIVYVNDDWNEFYYTNGLLTDESPFCFLTTTNALPKYGVVDRNYTKVGVKLRENADYHTFEELWYFINDKDSDMLLLSAGDIKDDITAQKSKFIFIIFLFLLMLAVLSFMILSCFIRLQLNEYASNVMILQILGCNSGKIILVWLRMIVKNVLLAGLVGWFPLLLYEMRIFLFYRAAGNALSVSDLFHNRMGILQYTPELMNQGIQGGMNNLLQYPYGLFYLGTFMICMLLFSSIVICSVRFTIPRLDEKIISD